MRVGVVTLLDVGAELCVGQEDKLAAWAVEVLRERNLNGEAWGNSWGMW